MRGPDSECGYSGEGTDDEPATNAAERATNDVTRAHERAADDVTRTHERATNDVERAHERPLPNVWHGRHSWGDVTGAM